MGRNTPLSPRLSMAIHPLCFLVVAPSMHSYCCGSYCRADVKHDCQSAAASSAVLMSGCSATVLCTRLIRRSMIPSCRNSRSAEFSFYFLALFCSFSASSPLSALLRTDPWQVSCNFQMGLLMGHGNPLHCQPSLP